MTRLLAGALISIVNCQLAWSAFSPAIPFFRSPESRFSSGQARLEDLEEAKIGTQKVSFYQVKKDQKEFNLDAAAVSRDLDLSLMVINTKTGRSGFIQKYNSPWYEVRYDDGQVSWTPAPDLAPQTDDLGLAQVTIAHPFRKTPAWKDHSNHTAMALEKYKVLDFSDKFVHVRSLRETNLEGYLELSNVILKVDFSSFVLTKNQPWRSFSYREGSQLVLSGNKRIELHEAASIMTKPELGILNQSAEPNLVARSTVQIQKGQWTQWSESLLKDHGRVFWQQAFIENSKSKENKFNTEDILSRDFFQMSLHPEHQSEAVVSARGVFYTQDGKSWTRLTLFNDENLPVSFGSKGELFVGNFISIDKGVTFKPYLRWEDLTKLIEQKHHKTPGTLKISEIKPLSQDQIKISLDTGIHKIWIQGSTKFGLVTNWQETQAN